MTYVMSALILQINYFCYWMRGESIPPFTVFDQIWTFMILILETIGDLDRFAYVLFLNFSLYMNIFR